MLYLKIGSVNKSFARLRHNCLPFNSCLYGIMQSFKLLHPVTEPHLIVVVAWSYNSRHLLAVKWKTLARQIQRLEIRLCKTRVHRKRSGKGWATMWLVLVVSSQTWRRASPCHYASCSSLYYPLTGLDHFSRTQTLSHTTIPKVRNLYSQTQNAYMIFVHSSDKRVNSLPIFFFILWAHSQSVFNASFTFFHVLVLSGLFSYYCVTGFL